MCGLRPWVRSTDTTLYQVCRPSFSNKKDGLTQSRRSGPRVVLLELSSPPTKTCSDMIGNGINREGRLAL